MKSVVIYEMQFCGTVKADPMNKCFVQLH